MAGGAGNRASRHSKALAEARFWHFLRGQRRRRRPGRPAIEREIRSLIRRMSRKNLLWGAPRIHGGVLKLGVQVCQTTVAKTMVRHAGPPSRSWSTFLRNHAQGLVPGEILPRSRSGFPAPLTRVAAAIKRWLTAKFHKPLSSHAAAAWDIEDERISYQAVLRPQNYKVNAFIDLASRGPPGVRLLFNNLSLPSMPVATLCPVTSGSTSKVRWKEVAETIDRRCNRPNSEYTDQQTLST